MEGGAHHNFSCVLPFNKQKFVIPDPPNGPTRTFSGQFIFGGLGEAYPVASDGPTGEDPFFKEIPEELWACVEVIYIELIASTQDIGID